MMDTKASKVLRSKMADLDEYLDDFLTNRGRLIRPLGMLLQL